MEDFFFKRDPISVLKSARANIIGEITRADLLKVNKAIGKLEAENA